MIEKTLVEERPAGAAFQSRQILNIFHAETELPDKIDGGLQTGRNDVGTFEWRFPVKQVETA